MAFDDRRSAKLQRLSDRAFNTFLPTQADFVVNSSKDWLKSDRQRVVDEVEVPLVPANDILAGHFPAGFDFLSIDTEGCNLEIIESIDFGRFRPKIICIEASDDFSPIMKANNYEFLARTPDNMIFHNVR
ncbi:MAG: FkbM family methyltransferase [Bradyrhizobium sp.]